MTKKIGIGRYVVRVMIEGAETQDHHFKTKAEQEDGYKMLRLAETKKIIVKKIN